MSKTILLKLALVVFALSNCQIFSLVANNPTPANDVDLSPTSPPTQISQPIATPLTPTVLVSSPKPLATATNSPSATALDALRKAFSTSTVKTFRAKWMSTYGENIPVGTVDTTIIEAVLPDRFHFVPSSKYYPDSYFIGHTQYFKSGGQWRKLPGSIQWAPTFVQWDLVLDNLKTPIDVKLTGTEVLDGIPTQVYLCNCLLSFKGPITGSGTTKFWLSVSDNLPRKILITYTPGKYNDITFYDYNANITISPPIP